MDFLLMSAIVSSQKMLWTNTIEKKEVKKIENEFVYKDIENKIKDIVGTKVKVNHKPSGKGKIEIEYYSDAELERIFDLFLSTKN